MGALKLHNGSRIAIIGGGPAGTLFAHFALELARQMGIEITVTILDGKDFLRRGPPGCNMCAGVISENLRARLEKEGIQLPEERVQRHADGYFLQTQGFGLHLVHPQGKRGAISTVYRGSGPRFSPKTADVSFDDFLLSHVRERGVQVIEKVVADIILPADASQPVRLLCGGSGSHSEFHADLVVGAFGLNTAILNKVVALGFGYRPPRYVRAFQAELPANAERIRRQLGNNIYTFTPSRGRVRFAICTPKREHVTVSIIGYRDVDRSDLRELLAQPPLRRLFPPGDLLDQRWCCCRPRIAITPARKPFTDRFVIVGDACCSRYYKNGIESAFATAQLAAETAFNRGISESAFGRYYSKARQIIIRDNLYGRLLFKVYDLASRYWLLTQTYYLVASSQRKGDSTAQLARQVLWNMITGSAPYRDIFVQGCDARLQARLMMTTLRLAVERMRALVLGRGDEWMRQHSLSGEEGRYPAQEHASNGNDEPSRAGGSLPADLH